LASRRISTAATATSFSLRTSPSSSGASVTLTSSPVTTGSNISAAPRAPPATSRDKSRTVAIPSRDPGRGLTRTPRRINPSVTCFLPRLLANSGTSPSRSHRETYRDPTGIRSGCVWVPVLTAVIANGLVAVTTRRRARRPPSSRSLSERQTSRRATTPRLSGSTPTLRASAPRA